MSKQKTIQDYNILVTKTKQKYLNDKINFNSNYTFQEEQQEGFHYFLITNQGKATKIIFDHESQIIVEREIYIRDVKSIMEMLGTL